MKRRRLPQPHRRLLRLRRRARAARRDRAHRGQRKRDEALHVRGRAESEYEMMVGVGGVVLARKVLRRARGTSLRTGMRERPLAARGVLRECVSSRPARCELRRGAGWTTSILKSLFFFCGDLVVRFQAQADGRRD